MKPQSLISLVVAVITLISLLFLPLVSGNGVDITLPEAISEGDFGFGDIVPFIAAIGIIIGAVKNQKKSMVSLSIIGTLAWLSQIVNGAEEFTMHNLSIDDFISLLGAGYWITLICFIINIAVTATMKNEAPNQPKTAQGVPHQSFNSTVNPNVYNSGQVPPQNFNNGYQSPNGYNSGQVNPQGFNNGYQNPNGYNGGQVPPQGYNNGYGSTPNVQKNENGFITPDKYNSL